MWTVITWNRLLNQWFHMRGSATEEYAFENAKDWAKMCCPDLIVSLADPKGEIIWAEIGKHPIMGRCEDELCWCQDHPMDADHTVPQESSNT